MGCSGIGGIGVVVDNLNTIKIIKICTKITEENTIVLLIKRLGFTFVDDGTGRRGLKPSELIWLEIGVKSFNWVVVLIIYFVRINLPCLVTLKTY